MDRLGLIKDLTGIFSRSHVNITNISTLAHANQKLPIIKINCDLTQKDKVEKLIAKLKKLKEVKSIVYQFI